MAWEVRLELARLPGGEGHAAEAGALLKDVLAGLGDDTAAAALEAELLPAATAG